TRTTPSSARRRARRSSATSLSRIRTIAEENDMRGTMAAAGLGGAALALLVACTPEQGTNDEPAAGGSGDAAPAATQAAELLPLDREGRAALGLEHATARELYDALRERAGGG